MLDVKDPLVQLKITSVTCSSVAIGTTVYRLYVRRSRFWYDDGFAFVSLVALLLQICSIFMHVPDPAELSQLTRVAAYYILAVTFYIMIWSARLSILFSVIRIDPNPGGRRRLFYVGMLFILVWALLMAQLFWVCEPEPHWRNQATPQCKLNKGVAICQLVSDVIADTILLTAPLRLLSGLADPSLRRRLIAIFSTSIVTTIVSLVHAAYIIIGGGPKIIIAALVEDCCSLIVCNLPVVITASTDLTKRPVNAGHKRSSFSTSYMIFGGTKTVTVERLKTDVTAVSLDSLGQASTLPKRDTVSYSTEYVETPSDLSPGTGKSEAFSPV